MVTCSRSPNKTLQSYYTWCNCHSVSYRCSTRVNYESLQLLLLPFRLPLEVFCSDDTGGNFYSHRILQVSGPPDRHVPPSRERPERTHESRAARLDRRRVCAGHLGSETNTGTAAASRGHNGRMTTLLMNALIICVCVCVFVCGWVRVGGGGVYGFMTVFWCYRRRSPLNCNVQLRRHIF